MHRRFWYKFAALLIVLAFIVPVLAACGSEENTPAPTTTATVAPTATPTATQVIPTVTATRTSTPTATAIPTATPTATIAPTSTPTATPNIQPVKLGAIGSWSGPLATAGPLVDDAIAVVQAQLKKAGGTILGGRPIKITKYDDGSAVANTVAGYKKLVLEDKVSAVLFGGAASATITVASDAAEETKVPLFSIGSTPADLSNRPYTIRAVYPNQADVTDMTANFILNKLKPKTVGLLMGELTDIRDRARMFKQKLEPAGVKTISEQYASIDTLDYTPYLTKVKYANPDVLVVDFGGSIEPFISIFTQMAGLGGWGNTTFVSSSSASGTAVLKLKNPALAEGSYHWVYWASGLSYPGAKEMEQAYMDTVGHLPTSASHYYAFWAAIKAIELAGSDDPTAIAQAARSGKLQWDSPGGPYTIRPDGLSTNYGQMVQFKSGKLIPVQ